ncbi:MAG: DUF885 domain-containing protein [Acidiferrobacteraceae bacterium]|nr:DUF885 domain-containing protein [Acidiferrobacteraceae bacterium]
MINEDIRRLGIEIWAWRASQQQCSGDDIPRLPRSGESQRVSIATSRGHESRPEGWRPEFSASAVKQYRQQRDEFVRRWKAIDTSSLSVTDAVDHRLLGSLLSRVYWELDVLRSWERDALFWVDQALGPYMDLLLDPMAFSESRAKSAVKALEDAPAIFAEACSALNGTAVAPFAQAVIEQLSAGVDIRGGHFPDIGDRIAMSAGALEPHIPRSLHQSLAAASKKAGEAADNFRGWLESRVSSMKTDTAVGRDVFVWFLRNVALMAEEPEELVAGARREYCRSLVWEKLSAHQSISTPIPPLPSTADEQCEIEARDEQSIRDFYVNSGLLSQPDNLGHYHNAPIPDYVAPMGFLAVTNDLTDEYRLDQNGVSYVPDPSLDLGYFHAANARDPRAGIIHEGVHYQQLALCYRHENPLRRRYYDSGSNEGIAHYNEELMLQAGLFENAPHTRTVVWNFMRLRALRVEADIGLAMGDLSLEAAATLFSQKVDVDRATALKESAFYAGNPGVALAYQVGKHQLMRLIADAIQTRGENFNFQQIHDSVWNDGNVPFALLNWELNGIREDLDAIDADPLTGAMPPIPAYEL